LSFVVLVLTGIWMGQFYNPIPDGARDSMRYILTSAPAGFFARNLHYWAANAMLLTALLHMLRVLYTGAYKRPREANWLVGVGLLALTVGLVFTGSALKWDQEGLEGIAHNIEIANLLGGVGGWFSPPSVAAFPSSPACTSLTSPFCLSSWPPYSPCTPYSSSSTPRPQRAIPT